MQVFVYFVLNDANWAWSNSLETHLINEDDAHEDGKGEGRKVKRVSDNEVLIKTSAAGFGES